MSTSRYALGTKTVIAAVIMTLLLFALPFAHAAQGDLIFDIQSVTGLSGVDAICTTITRIDFTKVSTPGTDDDGVGGDWLGIVAYDGNGTPFMWDSGNASVPGAPGNWVVSNQETAPVSRPFTLAIHDTLIQAASLGDAMNGPIVETFVFDPATIDGGAPCAVLPVAGAEEPAPVEDVVEEPVPGCDVMITIPDGAVGATVTVDTPVYWKPGEMSDEVFPAGLNLRAIGLDASGGYYKVLYVCDYYWVPVSVLGPNYDSPWNGAPLPTQTVE